MTPMHHPQRVVTVGNGTADTWRPRAPHWRLQQLELGLKSL